MEVRQTKAGVLRAKSKPWMGAWILGLGSGLVSYSRGIHPLFKKMSFEDEIVFNGERI